MKLVKSVLALGIILGIIHLVAPGKLESWFSLSRTAFDRVDAHVESQKIQNHSKKVLETSPDQRPEVSAANPQALAELAAMGEKIASLSILDTNALNTYREPAERVLRYDPEAYEQFLWEEIDKDGSRSLIFFMMGLYLEGNDSPGPLVHKVLQKKGASDKQDLVKIFTMEGLFHRIDVGRDFAIDPLPEVRPDIENLVSSSQNLTLVKESLLALKTYYGYSRDQLMGMIRNHPNRDVLAEIF